MCMRSKNKGGVVFAVDAGVQLGGVKGAAMQPAVSHSSDPCNHRLTLAFLSEISTVLLLEMHAGKRSDFIGEQAFCQ